VEETSASDQRNLITKASIVNMATEMEDDRRENVRKLAQAHDVSARKGLRRSHENGKALKEVGEVGEQAVILDEKGAIQDV
jgi:cation transport regulator ChaB